MDFLEQSKAEARQLTLFGMIWRAVRSGIYLWWLTKKERPKDRLWWLELSDIRMPMPSNYGRRYTIFVYYRDPQTDKEYGFSLPFEGPLRSIKSANLILTWNAARGIYAITGSGVQQLKETFRRAVERRLDPNEELDCRVLVGSETHRVCDAYEDGTLEKGFQRRTEEEILRDWNGTPQPKD